MNRRWAIAARNVGPGKWSWLVFGPCPAGCEHPHTVLSREVGRYDTWDEAVEHVRTQLDPFFAYDRSRFTMLSSRFDTPTFLVETMVKIFRDVYGDELADAMEASIPPPYGTLGEEK